MYQEQNRDFANFATVKTNCDNVCLVLTPKTSYLPLIDIGLLGFSQVGEGLSAVAYRSLHLP